MLRFDHLPSDFNPMFLFLGERQDLAALANLLRSFARTPRPLDLGKQLSGAKSRPTLRLVPAVPFFVINVVMGLTKIRLTTFWWVSQLGMLPATCIFIWAGASAPSLESIRQKGAGGVLSLNVVLALVALGLFPLAARWAIRLWRPKEGARDDRQ